MKVCLACGQRFGGEDWQCPGCGHAPGVVDGFQAFAPEAAAAHDGFPADSFERLAGLEAGQFWFTSRNQLVCWALRRYFPHARSFLEIGCGTGFVLAGIRREFPHWRLCGGEVSSRGLACAAKRLPGVPLLQMNAGRVPFEEEFDVVGAFDVLEHVEEDRSVLAEMQRAVKPGGGIILSVPQHPFLWSRVDEYSFHKRRYRRRELVDKVIQAGFEVWRVTSFVFFLLPMLLLSRLRQRDPRGEFDPSAEYRIPRLANAILETVMDLERIVIRSGASLPAGGSLLLLAGRK